MYTYFFTGKIYPDGLKISFDPPLQLEIIQKDFRIFGNVVIEYNDSDIIVKFKTEKLYNSSNTSEIETLANFIEDAVRLPVDSYCFAKSYAFDLFISEFKDELGFSYSFLPRGEWNINTNDIDASKKTILILSKLYSMNNNSSLIQIMADFRMSIKYPKMTAGFCYRAIETIRQNFFDDNWIKMRKFLELEKKDFDHILKFAKPNRHGDYPSISYKERESLMNFTRQIIEKILQLV